MKLILTSIAFGFLGLIAGGSVGSEPVAIAFSIIGFFSPGIYTLEKVYEDIKKKENRHLEIITEACIFEEVKGIDIREIAVTDYKDIYSLSKELGYDYSIEKVKERIDYILKNTKDIILVAQKEDEVIGYIHGSHYELLYSDSLINILGFVVKEKYRNCGVGNLLIEKLEYLSKGKGYSGIRLVSGADRLNAHKFYEKHGYTNRKNQKNFIKMFD